MAGRDRQLNQGLTEIATGFGMLQQILEDRIIEECELPVQSEAFELIADGLVRGERGDLGLALIVQLATCGYDADCPDVPNWHLLDRIARFEADPRRKRQREREHEGSDRKVKKPHKRRAASVSADAA